MVTLGHSALGRASRAKRVRTACVNLDLQTDGLRAGEIRRSIIAFLKRGGRPDSDFDAAELIVGELLSNVVRYAPGRFRVGVSWEHGFAVIEIADAGRSFTYPRPPPELESPGGHGLRLAASLARELTVRRIDDRGNLVRAVLPVTRA